MKSHRSTYRDSQEAEDYHRSHNFERSEPRVYIRGVSYRTVVSDNGQLLFGKYKGKHVAEIARSYPKYIEWCNQCKRGFRTEAYKFLKSPFPRPPGFATSYAPGAKARVRQQVTKTGRPVFT